MPWCDKRVCHRTLNTYSLTLDSVFGTIGVVGGSAVNVNTVPVIGSVRCVLIVSCNSELIISIDVKYPLVY